MDSSVLPAAAGFGGGIGRCQSVCGALVAGVMLLGLYEGRAQRPAKELAAAVRPMARQLYQSFAQRFGHTDCRNLTGYDFSTPEGYQAFVDSGARQTKCANYITYVISELLTLTS